MTVKEASKDVVRDIVDSIQVMILSFIKCQGIPDILHQFDTNISSRLLYFIAPFTSDSIINCLLLGLILGTGSCKKEQIDEVNVRNQELRVIKESGSEWKLWGKEWIAKNKEGHRYGRR